MPTNDLELLQSYSLQPLLSRRNTFHSQKKEQKSLQIFLKRLARKTLNNIQLKLNILPTKHKKVKNMFQTRLGVDRVKPWSSVRINLGLGFRGPDIMTIDI